MGIKRDLSEDDLTKPLNEHKSSILGNKISILWSKEVDKAKKRNKSPSLTKVIFRCFAKDLGLYGLVLASMEIGVRMNQPMFLGLLLRYFNVDNKNNNDSLHYPMYINRLLNYWTPNQSPIIKSEAYLYATGIFLCSALTVIVLHPYLMAVMHTGMQMRVACCSLIYRKALRVNLTSMAEKTAGNVVNLMSNDVNRFDIAPMFFHYLWIAPFQMLIILYFLYREMGLASIAGILMITLFIPLQVWFGARTSKYRYKTALRTDERVRQMNEVIQGIQVIKMYAWEYPFSELIHKMRKNEMVVLRQTSYIRGMIMSFIIFITRSAIFLTVLMYVLGGKEITAEKVFMITSYYQIMRQTMTVFFPQALAQIAEANVAIKRIKMFLNSHETTIGDPTPMNPLVYPKYKPPSPGERGGEILILNASAKYDNEVCLKDISLSMVPGKLTTIIGQVGSGKTCLLNLVLGELQPFSGKMIVKGTISYASQEPWLFAGSVQQNILFGRIFDSNRYQTVVRVCALIRDFLILPYGDRTIVGERGVSLSGGQRARVNLARAVYKEADIYILDDPLSAVDTHVGKHLFEQCINGYLQDKVVILVTHQLQYLKVVDQIVIMDCGMIEAKGTYSQLQASGLDFAHFLPEDVPERKPKQEEKKVDVVMRHLSITSGMHVTIIDPEKAMQQKTRAIAEMHSSGSVDAYVYKRYFQAAGNCCSIAFMVFLFLFTQCLASGGDYFLSKWIDMEEMAFQGLDHNLGIWDMSRQMSIIVYSIIIILTVIVAITRSLYFFTICMRASVSLHNQMFDSIIKASMRFFNTNTSGRILNRFSKDLGSVDELLPNAMIDSVQIILNLVGAIIVVTVVNAYLLIPTVIMCVAFYILRRYYLCTSRSVKRLEGITKSPVFAHLNATLQGLPTIRSNGAEMILVKEFDKYQDVHSSSWYMFIATSRAFGFWLDLICTIFIGIVTFSFLVFDYDTMGSEAGLAITQCIGLSGLFQWGMRQSAELENQMTAVERVLEFTTVEHESALESTPGKKPPVNWPTKGKIEFRNLQMRYNLNEPLVLKNLNFIITPREKVGIVGRTGAGKSSLMAALFRLAYYDGLVIIDNVDIGQLGLHDLRKAISIIPQEPFLFSGTLRYNLDPFHEYDDTVIFNALVDVEIKSALADGQACLEQIISEGGTNFSVGERQMICLARAIIRNNIILVLDEATANVDPQTDTFIQTKIRTKFGHCTVLTIAHRLHTIMDSDRVIVMDNGHIVEFDHPHLLLANKSGTFSGMVEKTGPYIAEKLKAIAKNSYQAKVVN